MKTRGGGWTVLQHRTNGSVNFHRGWRDYKMVGSTDRKVGDRHYQYRQYVSVLWDRTGSSNNYPGVVWHRDAWETDQPVIPGDLRLLYLAALMFSTTPHVIAPAITPSPCHTPTHPLTHAQIQTQTHTHTLTHTHTHTHTQVMYFNDHRALLFVSNLQISIAFLQREFSEVMRVTTYPLARLKKTEWR